MLNLVRRLGLGALAATALSSLSSAAPANVAIRSLEERASSADRLVFCHFMVGSRSWTILDSANSITCCRSASSVTVAARLTMMMICSVPKPLALTPLL